MHIAAIAAGCILLVAGYVFLFKSLNEHLQLHHEINAKLPPSGKFEPTFWGWGTREKLNGLQRELLPDSARPQKFRRFSLIGIACLMSGVLLLVAVLAK